MMERIDYWRGFTGGLIAGVAIGAWIYFTPRSERKIIDSEDLDRRQDGLSLRREAAESAGDPSSLIPDALGSTRLDFERPRP
jgi:hypothetical protein